MPAKRFTPKGRAIRWTAEDIAKLADIGPEDIAAAKANAKRLMPKRTQKLLNTKKQ